MVRATVVALILGTAGFPVRAADAKVMKPDDEGFIRNWLILAPIPLAENQSGGEGLDKHQIKDEAKLKPKDGDEAKAADMKLKWTKYQADDYFVDFNAQIGNTAEDSVGYAVTYIVADKPRKGVKVKIGSDDQCKVFLNGKQIIKSVENRGLEKDQDVSGPVDLKQGVNVVVFKVVNEKADFSGCLRFVDEKDKPIVKGLKVALKP